MQSDSIFNKIIKGEIPCHKVYEDDRTFAFLDIYPLQPGHILVIPKKQVEFLWDLDDDDYQAVMATTKKIALIQREVLATPYIAEKVVGVDVPHAHVHLIPFSDAAQLQVEQDMTKEPNHTELAKIAEKLKTRLN